MAAMNAEKIQALRDEYFAFHKRFADWKDRPIFVDKFPLNIAHMGLIYRLFPRAKVIFALRHPCDCVLSCFMQGLALNESMIHFLDLGDAARLYNQVMDLWCSYQDVLPLNVYQLRYEDLVGNFRVSVSQLLDFLSIEWNDSVLTYDKTARARGLINTPSYAQVTEKSTPAPAGDG